LAHIQPGSLQAAPNRRYSAKTLARLIGVEIEKVADRVKRIACPGPVVKNPDQGVPLRSFDAAGRLLGRSRVALRILDRLMENGDPQTL
jgi:hypothetical protein